MHKNHVGSYDFVQARTYDGRVSRVLVIIDECTRKCLSINVSRKLNDNDVWQPG